MASGKSTPYLLLLLVGCGRSPELVQADQVLHALDELRRAPVADIEGRRALVQALQALPAELPEAAAARDSCVAVFRPLIEGEALTREVQAALKSGAEPTLETAASLATAEARIGESNAAMPACERAAVDLRKRLAR